MARLCIAVGTTLLSASAALLAWYATTLVMEHFDPSIRRWIIRRRDTKIEEIKSETEES